MAGISIESLLEPLAPDAACGKNLDEDPLFGEMERAAKGKPEEQFGDTVKPAEDPNWREVHKKALELLGRTKDVRVATYLARASLGSGGLLPFRDSLAVLGGFVDRYWDDVHPQLDPDDDPPLDPTLRVNTLTTLCDHDATLQLLERTPIVRSRALGQYSMRDVAVAKGELPQPDPDSPLEMTTIVAAFTDADLDELRTDADAVQQAIDHVTALETSLTDRVGVANAASLAPLVDALKKMQQVLVDQLSRRGVVEAPLADTAVPGEDNGATATGGTYQISGEITSREDAVRTLDKVCDYYQRHEPSSPLPMLLRRAQRLANKSFIEIIRDIAPDIRSQAESLGGIDSSGETNG